MVIEAYTDGAYSSTTKAGGIGIVFVKEGKVVKTYSKRFEDEETTNNKMELIAVIMVLKAISKPCDLVIYTDSQYVLGCAIKGWKRSKNQALWAIYDEAYAKAAALCNTIEFKWCKGHENTEFNNMADKLAQAARK